MHPTFLLLSYCCLVFLVVDILVAFSSAIVWILVGLELEPPSDEPYFSTSLQDFWGRRRWNLECTAPHSLWTKWLGPDSRAPFHELLFFYVTRVTPGVCVVLEFGVKRAFNGKWRLKGTLTVGFVVATGFWFFFPPLVRNGADDEVFEEFKVSVEFVMSKIKWPV